MGWVLGGTHELSISKILAAALLIIEYFHDVFLHYQNTSISATLNAWPTLKSYQGFTLSVISSICTPLYGSHKIGHGWLWIMMGGKKSDSSVCTRSWTSGWGRCDNKCPESVALYVWHRRIIELIVFGMTGRESGERSAVHAVSSCLVFTVRSAWRPRRAHLPGV